MNLELSIKKDDIGTFLSDNRVKVNIRNFLQEKAELIPLSCVNGRMSLDNLKAVCRWTSSRCLGVQMNTIGITQEQGNEEMVSETQ